MTVDHIIPKSRGGTYALKNLDPMCYQCNQDKGDNMKGEIKPIRNKPNGSKVYDIRVGDIVYKKITGEFLGEVVEILPNLKHPKKKMSARIKERNYNSLYTLSSLYTIAK